MPLDEIDRDWDEDVVGDDDLAVLNGVHLTRGAYAERPLPLPLLCALAEGRALSKAELDALKDRVHQGKAHLGVPHGVDENDLAQSGWGVVFAADDPQLDDKRQALEPLLALRRTEAGPLYQELSGDRGLRPDEGGFAFLARHGLGPGPVDPKRLPYYLLLVGTPAQLPFAVQTDIDSRHAVGRLDVETPDALHAYAESIARRERDRATTPPRAAFFATRNAGDVSTQRSARFLAKPLAESFSTTHAAWSLTPRFAAQATRDALGELLHGDQAPALLFTASHGACLDPADPAQRARQGALVTQEWGGPMLPGPVGDGALFAASDVGDDAALPGTIAFLFACFGAGTPALDEFVPADDGSVRTLATEPFVARLPQRLLARGAGAVIGHVERAWTCSFQWPGAGAQTMVFESVLNALVDRWRVGAAVAHLNARYGEIAIELSEELRRRRFGKLNDAMVAGLWTAQTDARNYVVLGDPAVRLTTAP